MNSFNEINAGVDASQPQPDLYVRPLDECFSVPNILVSVCAQPSKGICSLKKTRHEAGFSKLDPAA